MGWPWPLSPDTDLPDTPLRLRHRFKPRRTAQQDPNCLRNAQAGRQMPDAAKPAVRLAERWTMPGNILSTHDDFAGLIGARLAPELPMVPFFVQIKCQLGRSYDVANKLADAELASEIYSTAGNYDLLVKFYVEDKTDIGHFVTEKVQTISGIQDTHTIITFKAF
jgi:DNA-binding Lrp family transcriptional regulator